MIARADVVAEARTWLDTPYRHQGRLKGVGCDCAGLLVMTMTALGMHVHDAEGYARRPDGTLLPYCDSQMERITRAKAQAGDVVLFHWNNSPVHLAFLTGPNSIIHAFAINRRVVEHDLDEKWRQQITAYFHIPGVE